MRLPRPSLTLRSKPYPLDLVEIIEESLNLHLLDLDCIHGNEDLCHLANDRHWHLDPGVFCQGSSRSGRRGNQPSGTGRLATRPPPALPVHLP